MVILDLKSVDPVDVVLKNKLQDFFDNYLKLKLNEDNVKLLLLDCIETYYNSYIDLSYLGVDYESLALLKNTIEKKRIEYGLDVQGLKKAESN